jgi:uncharacterized membrane protein
VIASIARDLSAAIDTEMSVGAAAGDLESEPSVTELLFRMEESGAPVPAPRTGYLQFVAYDALADIATQADGVIYMLYRPGHFIVEGFTLATVWPASAAADVTRAMARAHVTGPNRTLTQDLTFAIDQLVEIAIRALSPAVNDTFTALTCIDWLSDGLCKLTARWKPRRVHRDREANVRVIAADAPYSRFVERAFDKIRQAGKAMPAVMIRQLDALAKVMEFATTTEQRAALLEQADMIWRLCEDSVSEPNDREDVRRRYDLVRSVRGSNRYPIPDSVTK